MSVNAVEVLADEGLEDLRVLVQSGKSWRIDLPHLVSLDQFNKEPEGDFLGGVEEEGAHDEVHALHVADFRIVLGEGEQHTFQLLQSHSPLSKQRHPGKCPPNVPPYLHPV